MIINFRKMKEKHNENFKKREYKRKSEFTAEKYDWTEKYTRGIQKQTRWNRIKDQ